MARRFCVNVQVKLHLTQIPPKWQSAIAVVLIIGISIIITVTAPACIAVALLLAGA